jgi:hypothetical protein
LPRISRGSKDARPPARRPAGPPVSEARQEIDALQEAGEAVNDLPDTEDGQDVHKEGAPISV